MENEKKQKLLKVCAVVCVVAGLLSLVIFIPQIRELIINLGEKYVGRPLTHEVWHKRLINWENGFLILDIFLVFIAWSQFGKSKIMELVRRNNRRVLVLFSLFSCLLVSVYALLRIPAMALPFSLFAAAAIVAISVLALRVKDETTTMIATLGLLGTFYFFICPFEMPPDEPAHFLRAFEISTGRLFAKPLSSGAFGDVLPSALKDCWNRAAIIDWSDTAEIAFSTSALYSFVSYIPQSIGMLLARIFTNRLAAVYYAGRLFNFLSAFALSAFALKKIPFGKKMLFVIMVFPMTLQEMISLAPDSFLNALSFAFVAFILHCAYVKEHVTKKDILLIGGMLSVLSLCKVVYLVAVFLVYIIPGSKLGRKEQYFLKVLVPLIAIALSLACLSASAHVLVESHATYGNKEVNAKEQVKFILAHPLSYTWIFVRSLFLHAPGWIGTCIGSSLGWLNIKTGSVVCIPFALLVLWLSVRCNDIFVQLRKKDILFFALTFLSGVVLILTSLYVQWTPLRNGIIEGVQGRYFIPLLPSLFLALAYIRSGKVVAEKRKSPYLLVAVLALNFMALIAVRKFYPNILFTAPLKMTASLAGDSSAIHLLFKNARQNDEITVAVWSEANGQDDLQWFNVGKANGESQIEYVLPLESYSTDGKYFIHMYRKSKNRNDFMGSTELQIYFSNKNGVAENDY